MEKRKRNGLEITCIGALYQGAWEKKYWSSSRGKDRYPYPVGYQAVRSYNGHSFHMEVHEGGRGPLFVVSLGGMMFPGDTPTIAWQAALKKAGSLSKKMPGRFLSSQVNGSELFGFLDPLVQRLFRELVSLQDGEAQPDDKVAPDDKAGKVFPQKSTRLGSPEGFGWDSTRTAPVRKPRTSIVHSAETNASSLCKESKLNHLKGGRKCLKLAKPSNKAREDTALELLVPSNLASLQGASVEPSQCQRESREENLVSIKMPEDHTCLSESTEATNLVQDYQKKEVSQGAIVPDSFDEFPSQVFAGLQGIQTKVSLVNVSCDVKEKNLASTSGADACLPSQGLLPNLSKSRACDKIQILKEEININSSQTKLLTLEIESQDLDLPSKNSRELQLTNVVVPDSFDNDSGVMLINHAHSHTQAVVADSQIVGEQNEVDKCRNSPPCDGKEDSPSSEGNTQRGESDSLGQELTKSMIRLLLPQALKLIGKKKRRKKLITSKVVKQVLDGGVVELSNGDEQLAGLAENRTYCPASFPNQVDDSQALDSKSISREGLLNIPAEGDRIHSETKQSQLQNEGLDHCSGASSCDSDFLKMVDEICLEKLDKVNDEPMNELGLTFNAQPLKNRECSNADLANLAHQQTQIDVHHHLVSSTALSGVNTVLPLKTALLESSAGQNFSEKEQVHDVNDTASVLLSYISPKSHHVEDEYRSLGDHQIHSLEPSCPKQLEIKELCLPSPKSLKVVDTSKGLSNGVEAVTVEKSPTQFKIQHSMESELVPDLGSDACATAENTSKIIRGENLLTASSACGNNKLPSPQKKSAESIAVEELLTCQEAKNLNPKEAKGVENGCVVQRSGDAFEHEPKDLLQTETFVPKACLDHRMPVLAMKISVQDDEVHFFICCEVQKNTRVLFVYQTTRQEFKASLIISITFDLLDYACDGVCKEHVEANGIQFTPNGQELLLLSMFIVRETTKEVQQHTCFHGLQLVSYADGKVCVHTRLDASGRRVYCALLLDTCMVIAGGENGFVTCWILDNFWRSCKESFALPVPEGHQFSHVVQLSGVPALPWIAIGCDHRGFIAIWNSTSRQLLRASKLSVDTPLEIHLLNIDLVIPNSCDELNKDSSMMNLGRTYGNGISEKVAALFLVSTLDCNRMAPRDSALQSASKSWSLELFKRNGTSAVFEIDEFQERISTVEVLNGLGVAGTNDGCVHLWDCRSGAVGNTFSELKGEPVACIAGDQACSILAVAGSSGRVLIYIRNKESQRHPI